MKFWSTEKSYTITFKEILLCSSFSKYFDAFPKQKVNVTLYYLTLLFKYVNLCFIYIQTNSHHHCNVKYFSKVNISFFFLLHQHYH